MVESHTERQRSPDPFGDNLTGKTLGGCRLLRKIGEGGMGVVYLAHHLALNKQVAVKLLPASLAQDESRVKRFIREARSSAQLEHSNIVQILNIAKQEGLYFIVMQYIDGESLGRKIKRAGRLPVDEATRIIRDAAQALAAAHQKGIIHRDVKPENIMLTASGEVKLMDFGLARIRDMVSDITSPGDILGTPYYLAPEQARGEAVDGRADIYSLGVTYYYALTGKRPFEGETPVTVIMKHINESPPDPRRLTPDIPPQAFQVLMKMMHKDVKARYQNAVELIKDLEGLVVTISSLPRRQADDISTKTVTYPDVRRGGPTIEKKPRMHFGPELSAEGLSGSRPHRNLIIIGGLVALVLIVLGLAMLIRKDNLGKEKPDISTAPESSPVSTSVIPPGKEAFDKAFKYYTDHPNEYLRNIKAFETFITKYPDTEWTPRATRIIHSLKQELKTNLQHRCTEFYNHLFAGEYEALANYFVPGLFPKAKDKMVDFYRRVAGMRKLGRIKVEQISIGQIEPQLHRFGQLKTSVKVTYKYMQSNKPSVFREFQHIWIYKNNNWYFFRLKKLPSDEKKPLRQRRR